MRTGQEIQRAALFLNALVESGYVRDYSRDTQHNLLGCASALNWVLGREGAGPSAVQTTLDGLEESLGQSDFPA